MNARQYKKILLALTQIVDEGIHIVDKDGTSIAYNEAIANLEKVNVEDVLGKKFRAVFSHIPENDSTLLRALEKGTGTASQQQTYLNQYAKEVTTVNATTPVFDDDGQVIAAIETAKDITDIKRLSNTILDLQGESITPYKVKKNGIKKYDFQDIIGENRDFKDVVELAKKASASTASVFIYGETGTGKELFAQSIHYGGARKEKPFLAQNCAALPESLLEGILFGTAKGGFTGAVDRAGLFEQANGGTLLLDEVSAMPYELQSKLLRVLQEDYIRRVGGTKDIPVDVRIIATVNEPISDLLASGRLRRDLYYRLSIVNINLPPLRERKDDIPLLVDCFLKKHNARFNREVWILSDAAMDKLMKHDYPGNVRELENIIMAAVSLAGRNEHILTEKAINVQNNLHSAKNNKSDYSYNSSECSLDEYFEHVEISILKETMAKHSGNISRAAAELGIKRQTLQHKLKKYDL